MSRNCSVASRTSRTATRAWSKTSSCRRAQPRIPRMRRFARFATAEFEAPSRAPPRRVISIRASARRSQEQAERVGRLAARWHGSEGGRLRLSIGPLLPWVMDEHGFRETRRIARDNGLSLHMHVAESPEFNQDDRPPFRPQHSAGRAARGGRLPGSGRAGRCLLGRLAARNRAPGRERHRRPVRPSDASVLGYRISADQGFPDGWRDLRCRNERRRRKLRPGHFREHEIRMRDRQDCCERSARAHRRPRAPNGDNRRSASDRAASRRDPSRSESGPT